MKKLLIKLTEAVEPALVTELNSPGLDEITIAEGLIKATRDGESELICRIDQQGATEHDELSIFGQVQGFKKITITVGR